MAFTYDTDTNVGRVRLLVPDRVQSNAIFTDAEIETFLTVEGDSIKKASALALETIAADEALVQKVQTTLGESTDGAALMDSLMKKAAAFRAQAKIEENAIPRSDGSSGTQLTRTDGYSYPCRTEYSDCRPYRCR